MFFWYLSCLSTLPWVGCRPVYSPWRSQARINDGGWIRKVIWQSKSNTWIKVTTFRNGRCPDGGRWSAEVNPGLFMGAKRLTVMHRQKGRLKWPHVCPTLRWKSQVSQLRVKRLKKWCRPAVSPVSPASEHGVTHWFVRSWYEAVSWMFLLGPSEFQMGWTKVGFDYEIIYIRSVSRTSSFSEHIPDISPFSLLLWP